MRWTKIIIGSSVHANKYKNSSNRLSMYSYKNITRVLAAVVLSAVMSGCAYVIPPDQNAPRNNSVEGPMRKPLNNPANPRAVKPQAAVTAVPGANPYSPVQSVAHGQGEQQMASLATPTAPVAVLSSNERRVPVENAQVAAAGYPPIDSVPPRPATEGPDSVKQRMSDTQQSLEQGRATAEQSKQQLSRDVNAEPSMLSDMPKTQAPSAVSPAAVQQPANPQPIQQPLVRPGASVQPAYSQPVAQVQPQLVPQQIVVSTNQMPMLPPAPSFAPPPPTAGQSAVLQPAKQQSQQATVRQVPVAIVAAASPSKMPEPIGTMEPTSVVPLPAVDVDLPPATASTEVESVVSGDTMTVARTHPAIGVTVRKGDFDPLAAADNAPVASSSAAPVGFERSHAAASNSSYVASRYMTPSRYYDQR